MTSAFTNMSTVTPTHGMNITTPMFEGRLGFGEMEKYDEFFAAYYLNKSGLWILTLIGLVCNTLAFWTIYSIKPFATSSFYVALLAVLDTVVLVMRLLYQQLTGYNVPMGNAGCAIFSFLGSFFLHLSTWTLVTMTIERFVAVWFPLRVTELFTLKSARLSIVFMAVVLILINMPILWMFHEYIHPIPGIDRDCGFRPQYQHFQRTVWDWLNSAIYAFIPCVSLILLNALIIFGLSRSFKMQRQMTSNDSGASSKSAQQRQITVMLVTVSVAFAVFLLPLCIFHLVPWTPTNTREAARQLLAKEIVFFVAELHHAVNFLFYFCSSRKFRTMLLRLVSCQQSGTRRSVYQSQLGATSATQSTSMSNEL